MKVVLVSGKSHLREQLAALGAARTPPVKLVALNSRLQDAGKTMAGDAPQLVMLDASLADAGEFAAMERFAAQYPQTAFMLLAPDQSPELLIRAMRAGVREVLPLPVDEKSFNDALDRIACKASPALRDGKVLSFISCKGGSGATFLAANFSHALASLGQKKVLLIDLNQQFGDALLYVSDKKPSMTLSDICVQIDRIDPEFLASSLVGVSPNFGILAASDDPTRIVDIEPEHIETILKLARKHYDFIVLDVGRRIDNVTIRALDESDMVYPVLQLGLPYIRDGRRLMDIFRSLGYARDKVRLIVNRFEKNSKVRVSDLESVLGTGISHTVPNNFDAVAESINQGIPILDLYRGSPVVKGLTGILDHWVGMRETQNKRIFDRIFFSRNTQAAV